MMPMMNPKQMKKMMAKLGMRMVEVPASEVVIKADSGDIIVKNPNVVRTKVQGQDSFQISGTVEESGAEGGAEAEETAEVSKEDIEVVMQQANVSEEAARKALQDAGGDLAKAILSLEEK